MAALPIIIGVAGLAMGGLGVMQQAGAQRAAGEQASNQAQTQASMYAYNSKMAEFNATEAKAASDRALTQQGRKTAALLGTQRMAYAKAGVDMTGSPLEVQNDTVTQAEYDRLALSHEGDMNIWRAKNQKQQMDFAGESVLAGGEYQSDAAMWGAGTTLLTGVGKLAAGSADLWKKYTYQGKSGPGNGITVGP